MPSSPLSNQTRAFAVYALLANREHDHDLRFAGKITCEPHEDAIEHEVDKLLEQKFGGLPRDGNDPEAHKRDGWEMGRVPAVVCFPEDELFQIAPTKQRIKLGYGTSASRPRRMSVRF